MIDKIREWFATKEVSSKDANKMYIKCSKLLEDYSEDQLIKMYGKDKTEFIKANPEDWI